MKLNIKFFNKKAESDISARKIIFYIIFGFLATIAFLFIAFLVPKTNVEISIIPAGLENYLLTQRFFNSPLCFALVDDSSNRVYPSIIDLEKFNQETLNKCYHTGDTNVKAYKLTLNYEQDSKTVSTKNWQEFLSKAQTKHVFVYDNGKIKGGNLFVETQDAE